MPSSVASWIWSWGWPSLCCCNRAAAEKAKRCEEVSIKFGKKELYCGCNHEQSFYPRQTTRMIGVWTPSFPKETYHGQSCFQHERIAGWLCRRAA